jgi:hypothetical protein
MTGLPTPLVNAEPKERAKPHFRPQQPAQHADFFGGTPNAQPVNATCRRVRGAGIQRAGAEIDTLDHTLQTETIKPQISSAQPRP